MVAATRQIRLACGAVPGGAFIGGIHLEGPYLNPRHGAQQAGYTATPDDATTARFLDAAGDRLAMVTLAPELPGAIETTQRLVEAGVVVSLGHTACGRDDYRAARRAGASHVTHLFNAMQSPEAIRGEPYAGVRPVGLEELALVDDDVSIDFVVDSECAHVATAVLESALRCKPEGTVSLISDSMAAGGLPPGKHRLADGRTIHTSAHHDVARLPGGLLCGSTMSMAGALRNAVRQLGVPVATALRMASEAPARALGIGDRIGRIGVGAAADLIIFSSDLHVRTTIVGGIPAYSAGENEDR